jgi:callose synthase
LLRFFFALRFFIFQYGLVYQLSAFKNKYSSLWVFGASWLLILILLLTVTVLDYARRRLGTEFQLLFRIIKVSLFLAFMAIFITLMTCRLILPQDVFLCMLALIPTGWGLLLIAQSCKPLIQQPGIWSWVMTLAWVYDLVMGSLLFIPIAFMAWFPFISEFQTRMLFNQAFSRGLHISRILSGQRKHRSSKNKD